MYYFEQVWAHFVCNVSVPNVFSIYSMSYGWGRGDRLTVQAWCAPDDPVIVWRLLSAVRGLRSFSLLFSVFSSRFSFWTCSFFFFRSALRVSPAESRLTVYCRLNMVWSLVKVVRSTLPTVTLGRPGLPTTFWSFALHFAFLCEPLQIFAWLFVVVLTVLPNSLEKLWSFLPPAAASHS